MKTEKPKLNLSKIDNYRTMEDFISHLLYLQAEAENIKDNTAYNKIVGVRLNVESLIAFFKKR